MIHKKVVPKIPVVKRPGVLPRKMVLTRTTVVVTKTMQLLPRRHSNNKRIDHPQNNGKTLVQVRLVSGVRYIQCVITFTTAKVYHVWYSLSYPPSIFDCITFSSENWLQMCSFKNVKIFILFPLFLKLVLLEIRSKVRHFTLQSVFLWKLNCDVKKEGFLNVSPFWKYCNYKLNISIGLMKNAFKFYLVTE